jgi:hypothetical protein
MPKAMEEALKKVANKYARQGKLKRKPKDSLEESKDRFVYEVMRKTGWKPSREKK